MIDDLLNKSIDSVVDHFFGRIEQYAPPNVMENDKAYLKQQIRNLVQLGIILEKASEK